MALDKLSKIVAKTEIGLVDQWNSEYTALAFPFSLPRVVGGADYPRRPRARRHQDAAVLTPWKFCKAYAARIESNIKSDWNLVPATRNLTTKWEALCGDDVACKHRVNMETAGNVHSAELATAATKLYEKLAKGFYTDAKGKRRNINNDFTKLYHCANLTETEQNLIRDMTFLSKKFSGTQQIRLMIGHALFGARVEYGEPWFFTISPSVRHSGLCVRLSRFRLSDPLLGPSSQNAESMKPWHQKDMPNL